MKLKGIITPMMTPFRSDGSIDLELTGRLLEYVHDIGVIGVFPNASIGLFPFLSVDEKKKFLEFVVENSRGMKVLAGIGSSSTEEAITLGEHAKDVGVDALVLMPTYYIIPGQKEILKHFSDVIRKVRKELFIYNIPQLSGSRIEPETIGTLVSNFPEVVGIKESSADMRYFSRIMEFSSSEFSIFQGQDDLLIPSMSVGADGGVCGLTNFSDFIVKVYDRYVEGDQERARDIQVNTIGPLVKALLTSTFPSTYYYALYRKFGISGGYRTPMVEPEQASKDAVNRLLGETKAPNKV